MAPAGFGKSSHLQALAARIEADATRGVALVSLTQCEDQASLFVAELRRAARERGATGLAAASGGKSASEQLIRQILEGIRGGEGAVLLLDDVDRLSVDGELHELVRALVTEPPDGISLVLAADIGLGPEVPGAVRVGGDELAMTAEEVRARLGALCGGADDALVELVARQTQGLPALVELAVQSAASNGGDPHLAVRESLDGRAGSASRGVLEPLLGRLRPDVRHAARVLSILDEVDEELAVELLGAGSGDGRSRRRLIPLSQAAVHQACEVLRRERLMTAVGDGRWSLHPVVRRVLLAELGAIDAEALQEAQRRAALLLIRRGVTGVTPLALLFESGEHGLLLDHLEGAIGAVLDDGETEALASWLAALVERFPAAPTWVDHALGVVHARRGAWDDSREHLERARESATAAAEPWRWQPRLCLGYAEHYLRRGIFAQARTWAQRGLDHVEQGLRRQRIPEGGRAEARHIGLRLASLLAELALEVGSARRAQEVLEGVLARADGDADPAWRVRSLCQLAVNALRAADGSAAHDRAREGLAAARGALPGARAELLAVLVDHDLRWGGGDRSLDLAREAVAAAGGHHDAAPMARARMAEARALAAHGDGAGAVERLVAAVARAAAAARADLHGEALERLAIGLARAGRREQAAAAHEEAGPLLAGVVNQDGYLAGLAAEAEAELRLAAGRAASGLRHLEAARDTYLKFGAEYDVARLHWRQAEVHHRAAEEGGDPEHRDAALAQLEDACIVADEHGFTLEGDRARQGLAVVGALAGEDELASYCQALLRRLGLDPAKLDEATRAPAMGYRPVRGVPEAQTPFVMRTRDAEAPLARDAYDAVLAEPGPALVALVDELRVINYGKPIDLSQKRVMLPLLLHFLRSPDESFSMRELATAVWDTTDTGPSIQTKVKVAVSRLRTLLGKARKYIVTTRKEEEGASVAAYQLAPNVAFKIIARTET